MVAQLTMPSGGGGGERRCQYCPSECVEKDCTVGHELLLPVLLGLTFPDHAGTIQCLSKGRGRGGVGIMSSQVNPPPLCLMV